MEEIKLDANTLTIAQRKAIEAEKELREKEERIKANKAKTLEKETAQLGFIKAEFDKFKGDNSLIDKLSGIKATSDKICLQLFTVSVDTNILREGMKEGDVGTKDYRWWELAKVIIGNEKIPSGKIVKLLNEITIKPTKNLEYETVIKHNAAYPNEQRNLPSKFNMDGLYGYTSRFFFSTSPFKRGWDELQDTNPDCLMGIPSHMIEFVFPDNYDFFL
jgi:hypothetical protein